MAEKQQPPQKNQRSYSLIRNLSHCFQKRNRVLLTDPLDDNNPITVQVWGSVLLWPLRFNLNLLWL